MEILQLQTNCRNVLYEIKYMYIGLRRILHIEAISRQKEARSRDYALLVWV